MATTFTIRLAEKNIEVHSIYASTREFCQDYLLTDQKDQENQKDQEKQKNQLDFSVEIFPEDIDFERTKSAQEDEKEGIPIRHFSEEYLETLAVYRKIVEKLIFEDILLFHGSVIAVDGQGYLFTAKSGTGKSTHTRLWRKYFGQRAVMINDDKPLISIKKDKTIVYGTPWDGKHRLSSNTSVPLKAICILTRGEENRIEKISTKEAYPMLLQQSHRSKDPFAMSRTLARLDQLAENVELYHLACNMKLEAAKVAYEGMNVCE